MGEVLTRICTICEMEVSGRAPCPACSNESTWRDVSVMTPAEKVTEYERWTEVRQVEWPLVYRRMRQLFGRSVLTHELAESNRAVLTAELMVGQGDG